MRRPLAVICLGSPSGTGDAFGEQRERAGDARGVGEDRGGVLEHRVAHLGGDGDVGDERAGGELELLRRRVEQHARLGGEAALADGEVERVELDLAVAHVGDELGLADGEAVEVGGGPAGFGGDLPAAGPVGGS